MPSKFHASARSGAELDGHLRRLYRHLALVHVSLERRREAHVHGSAGRFDLERAAIRLHRLQRQSRLLPHQSEVAERRHIARVELQARFERLHGLHALVILRERDSTLRKRGRVGDGGRSGVHGQQHEVDGREAVHATHVSTAP